MVAAPFNYPRRAAGARPNVVLPWLTLPARRMPSSSWADARRGLTEQTGKPWAAPVGPVAMGTDRDGS